ncbi:VanZ family protein [candidate division KSB1 bacterium]|nr:VanZ family protein [candidate division KSB1 bacterium]
MVKNGFVYWKLPAIVWALIIIALTSYPKLSVPDLGFDAMDKVAHFAVYFILAVLVTRAIVQDKTKINNHIFFKSLIINSCFALFDEVHQIPIPGRVGDIFDLSADILGILFALFAFKILHIFTFDRKVTE